jgi:hypothetical protein
MTEGAVDVARLEQVREDRRRGDLLGELVDRYGAGLVVQALGVNHVACALGLRDEINGDDDDFEAMP